MSQLVKELLSD